MTVEGYTVDQCISGMLCGETLELEGTEMSYECFDNENEDEEG